jgi:hypothetical protein
MSIGSSRAVNGATTPSDLGGLRWSGGIEHGFDTDDKTIDPAHQLREFLQTLLALTCSLTGAIPGLADHPESVA